MASSDQEKILAELEGIKKLQILELLAKGFSQNQIALTLGISQASVSRMFPKGAIRKGKSGDSDHGD